MLDNVTTTLLRSCNCSPLTWKYTCTCQYKPSHRNSENWDCKLKISTCNVFNKSNIYIHGHKYVCTCT